MEEILASVQVRRDTKANWETINPILLEGEPAYELDTDMFKIGDGIKHYNDLPYHNKVGPQGPQGEPGPTPQISMNVSTGNPGTNASVSVTGTAENPVINLTVPRGDTGKTGSTGPKGDTGNSGVYIGTSQPTDSNINVWIDSDGKPTEVIDDFAREAIGKLKDDLSKKIDSDLAVIIEKNYQVQYKERLVISQDNNYAIAIPCVCYKGCKYRIKIKTSSNIEQPISSYVSISNDNNTSSSGRVMYIATDFNNDLSKGFESDFTSSGNSKYLIIYLPFIYSGNDELEVEVYNLDNDDKWYHKYTDKELYDREITYYDFCRQGSYDYSTGAFAENATREDKRATRLIELGKYKKVLSNITGGSNVEFIFYYANNDESSYLSFSNCTSEMIAPPNANFFSIHCASNVDDLSLFRFIVKDVIKDYSLQNDIKISELKNAKTKYIPKEELFTMVGKLPYSEAEVDETVTDWLTTDYIPMDNCCGYCRPVYTSNFKIWEYDENKKPIKSRIYRKTSEAPNAPTDNNVMVWNIPDETCAYLRISCYKTLTRGLILAYPLSEQYNAIDKLFLRDNKLTDWYVFGDSISDQGWATGGEIDYWQMCANLMGLKSHKLAKAASSFAQQSGKSTDVSIIRTKTSSLVGAKKSLITVLGGTNDFNQGPKGVWNEVGTGTRLMVNQENGKSLFAELMYKPFESLTPPSTEYNADYYFEEAFLYTMWELKNNNPNALIVCLLPTGRIGEDTPNQNGVTLQDYRDVEEKICNRLGIPTISMQTPVPAINSNSFGFNQATTSVGVVAEGLHPNAQGHKQMAAWLISQLRPLIEAWEIYHSGIFDEVYNTNSFYEKVIN